MSRDERREQILRAATAVFADGGYAGTTTDDVARAAGVSQPYVVRLFGTKQDLFHEVFDRIGTQILEVFEAVPAGPDAPRRLGDAYVRLLDDRATLRVLMHGFVAGSDPEIGKRARTVLVRVFELYQERTGHGPQDARDFVAQGMLINVLLSVAAPEHAAAEPGLTALLQCALGSELAAELAGSAA